MPLRVAGMFGIVYYIVPDLGEHLRSHYEGAEVVKYVDMIKEILKKKD